MAATDAWSIVAYALPVPLGVLALVGIALIYFIAHPLFSERVSAAVPTTEVSTEQPEYDLQVLSENELKVVRQLAAADGQWATLGDIASAIRLSRMVTEQALENLFGRGFLRDNHNYVHGTSFRLSSTGRDFAIEQGLVR